MYCVNCGKELSDEAKSCPYCGAEVNGAPIQEYDPMEDLMGLDEEPMLEEKPVQELVQEPVAQVEQEPVAQQSTQTPMQSASNGFAIAGFVCSFFVPILGIIFGAIGLSRSKKLNKKGFGLAVAALCISIVTIVLNIFVIGGLLSELLEEILYYEDYYVYPDYY